MKKRKVGRPKKTDKKVNQTFRIRPDLLEKLEAKATRIEVSVTYLVERAIMRELIWDN